jgi:hypothetical protein
VWRNAWCTAPPAASNSAVVKAAKAHLGSLVVTWVEGIGFVLELEAHLALVMGSLRRLPCQGSASLVRSRRFLVSSQGAHGKICTTFIEPFTPRLRGEELEPEGGVVEACQSAVESELITPLRR